MENHHEMIRHAWDGMEYATELDKKPMQKDRDKIRGSLIGGGAGDALGYAVEFWPESKIFSYYGKDGITQYRLVNGVAQISDDTQMTLFTANSLLFANTRGLWDPTPAILPKHTGYGMRLRRENIPPTKPPTTSSGWGTSRNCTPPGRRAPPV